jgi:SAM-dependent methyltransferase
MVDFGAGSGAGGINAARLAPDARVTLVDINPAALDLARVNALAADVAVKLVSELAEGEAPDVVIANPPYMMDDAGRAYRDGGDLLGGRVALDWAMQAVGALRTGGTLLLYTGAAYTKGEAPLITALNRICRDAAASITIEKIDPDVFGEELEKPSYNQVERIGAIGAVITTPR